MNILEEVTPILLAQGLLALRENAVMPSLVNTDYSTIAADKGEVINVPIPSAVEVTDVEPGPNNPDVGDSKPTSAPIKLDHWKEAAFYLTDKDIKNSIEGIIPMQASEAIKGLGNYIDRHLLSLSKDLYGFVGTPGVTPFQGSTRDVTQTRKVLNKQLAPKDSRRFVVDPDAEAEALDLRAFQDVSFSGSTSVMSEGEINNKLGFDWAMDQNLEGFTTGTRANDYVVGGATPAGSVVISVATGTGSMNKGDQFTKAGDSQTYVVVQDHPGGAGNVMVAPALKVACGGGEAITFKGGPEETYANNVAFHRDCFAFASRPLADTGNGLGNIIQSSVDPISGLTLRLEISREHKRIKFAYDILYGLGTVRRELGTRVWGAIQ